MATLEKIRQASSPGRQLVIIRAPSVEYPPAGGSRGTEAAMTQSGHRRAWLMIMMERKDLSELDAGGRWKKAGKNN